MKKEKKTTIVYVGKELSKEEIKNFEKDNPGYRLSFELRHPYFPMWCSTGILIVSTAILFLSIVIHTT